jgi:type I restriction enzyme S subunit
LNAEKVANIPVWLPGLPIQQAISAFLDRKTAAIDDLIRKKERLAELLQEKRQALITEAVTKGLDSRVPMKDSGVAWMGTVPAHWQVKRVKHVCRLETGHTPSRTEDSYWVPGECVIPWVSLNDTKTLESSDFISETKIKISQRGMANSTAHLIEAGAVVFNRDGARVGLAAITTLPMAVSQHIIAWVCGRTIDRQYLLHVIYAMETELYRLTAGATIPTIGMGDVKELCMPVPPMAEQAEIVAHVCAAKEHLASAVTKVEAQRDLLREYRQALITAAVTGQLDIPAEAA